MPVAMQNAVPATVGTSQIHERTAPAGFGSEGRQQSFLPCCFQCSSGRLP